MVASVNLTQTPVSGKYGRVFVSDTSGAVYPVNFKKWSVGFEADDIENPGFEDFGWKNGLTGLVGASIDLEGPFQVTRADGTVGAGLSLLVPGAFTVPVLYIVNPDYYAGFGSLLRYTMAAQVIPVNTDQDVKDKASITVRLVSRGAIYRPGQSSPTPAQILANFTNQAT